MKFGKEYSAVLHSPSFPQEWAGKAIDYRQLKKLINQVVEELSTLGLNPDLLQKVIVTDPRSPPRSNKPLSPPSESAVDDHSSNDEPRVVYEVSTPQDHAPVPLIRLRLQHHESLPIPGPSRRRLSDYSSRASITTDQSGDGDGDVVEATPKLDLHATNKSDSSLDVSSSFAPDSPRASCHAVLAEEIPHPSEDEVVIPLRSDTAFIQLLTDALTALSTLYQAILQHAEGEVEAISDLVSQSARPKSEGGKSDLETWRNIIQLWAEMQIFENLSERKHGETSITEAENKLKLFSDEVTKRRLDSPKSLRLVTSREALKRFYAMNVLILDVRKFQYANEEAARKILKKHEKRTALPSSAVIPSLSLTLRGKESLSRVLLMMMTQTVLPVIPSIDDYQCLICTSIAFKPIRLSCGHLFCVRCLVKMQRKGTEESGRCPLCRAPTVLTATKKNLDVALMNFMKDWFPRDTREKEKENEEEISSEMAEQMGVRPDTCTIM